MIGLVMAAVLPVSQAVHLHIERWTGKNFAATTPAAATYRLTVVGTPHTTVELDARNVADGWLAAFCTPQLCSPLSVRFTLPDSGRAVYQFELIREGSDAPKKSGAQIVGGGTAVSVPR